MSRIESQKRAITPGHTHPDLLEDSWIDLRIEQDDQWPWLESPSILAVDGNATDVLGEQIGRLNGRLGEEVRSKPGKHQNRRRL